MKKVLVIGSGGRCDAICRKLKESDKIDLVFAAPGNPGMSRYAIAVPIQVTEIEKLVEFAKKEAIDLTVVGPEAALALGVVDAFEAAGLRIFGPNKKATRIESSKAFAKELMQKYEIPTAAYQVFSDFEEALAYVKKGSFPVVLKYDGLAAGKGVVICEDLASAEATLKDMLVCDQFGHGQVVIEEYLEGPEFSYMCFVSGEQVYPMIPAQDHKRAFDNDEGPNTGGMGAYTGLSFLTAEDEKYAYEEIMVKTAQALVKEDSTFKGVLYGGLMKTKNGIKVIEFNARFGDPETEVVLPCLISDLYEVFCAIIDGKAPELLWDRRPTLGVVLASKGYPGDYEKGHSIFLPTFDDGYVFHMGTALKDGKLVTAGGRVLMVVGQGYTLAEAYSRAYEMVREIKCDNLFYRNDIGAKSLKE